MGSEAGRLAAYAELVAAVLDLRDPRPTERFDEALEAAVSTGQLSPELARELRALQRSTTRHLVDHAQAVLGPALLALENEAEANRTADVAAPPVALPVVPAVDAADDPGPAAADSESDLPPPPADLQARRLLVAGLRPLPDGPRRGTLP